MKYIIIIIFSLCPKISNAQVIDTSWYTIDSIDTYTHTDSVNKQLTEFIYNNRNCYIGSPMNKLYPDLPLAIGFSLPFTNRRAGIVGYQNFTLYLPSGDGDAFYGFEITIANKVYIDMKDYINKEHLDESDNFVKELVKNVIVTSIEKNY